MPKKINLKEPLSNRIENFQKLMRFKIREILLVSSLYDFYLFEEDGRLYELIREEYQSLNLSQAPEITHCSTASEAIEQLLVDDRFDLIITTMHIDDMHVSKFSYELRKRGINTPIILLAFDNKERKELQTHYDISYIEKIFIWQGDYRLLMGIIKYMEDKMNVQSDTKLVGVQSIILVEDNVKFYSTYLPHIYNEIFIQTQRLISEGVSLSHKFLRMRARPKILLCTTYEEGWNYFEKYQDFLLGIILDINFKKDGVRDIEAGIKFAKAVKNISNDIPLLLQSSNIDIGEKAKEIGVAFYHKGSPRLLHDLHDFMLNNFGFGDFVFRTSKGDVVGSANNLTTLEEQLKIVPDESILYHSERNHFSNWMKARTEFWLAHKLRPRKVSEFRTVDELREELISSIQQYQEIRQRGIITDFKKETFDPQNTFARIGGGSLGGKARGLGFINKLINNFNIRDKFENVEISVPSAIVIGTDVFDEFLVTNNLESFAFHETDDDKIVEKFQEARFTNQQFRDELKEFLTINNVPLAVRSSSLLEDSQFQPFAGVYQTFMIPNNNPDLEVRLQDLLQCIKCVYASTFYKKSKDYIKATSYRLEEEKMAVIVQRLVGNHHKERFYPDFAGVAKSYNFYPAAPQQPNDGIAMVALGLGKTVVEGGNSVRFCPKYPKHLMQFFSAKETIKNGQQKFYALRTDKQLHGGILTEKDLNDLLQEYELSVAEEDNTLNAVGSTYSFENDMIYDGTSRKGRRVVTFAPVLKHKIFPLADILTLLLDTGSWGMGTMVELEFAVNLNVKPGAPKEFALLQMRPLVLSQEMDEVQITIEDKESLLCESDQVLGNGVIRGIKDVVFVDINNYERSKSHQAALEVSKINSELVNSKTPYILIGVGRWGSLDPWLGIPITWDQIAGASVIIESGFKDFVVTPSQGSHFFQNITSFRIGYFTVNANHKAYIDWEWLNKQTPIAAYDYVKHIRFEDEFLVKINPHQNLGVIIKPEK